MQLNTFLEEVYVTFFIYGRSPYWVARTEVLRGHPSTFKEEAHIALNAEFIFKAAHYGTHGHAHNSFARAEPMDLSHADDEEAYLQAVGQ